MELRKIINEHKAHWYEVDNMQRHDQEIQRVISQLDEVAVKYEVKWGVGILQQKCRPELLAKWMKQCEKFSDAMRRHHVEDITELALGTIRAYDVLENDLLEQGIEPKDANFMAYDVDGTELIVCGDNEDVRIMTAKRKGRHNVVIWSMAEVASMVKERDLTWVLENKEKKACLLYTSDAADE